MSGAVMRTMSGPRAPTGWSHFYDGVEWRVESTPATERVEGLWGSGPEDVWAIERERVLHWNGQTWTTASEDGAFRRLKGHGPGDVWAMGWSHYLHWDGESWARHFPTVGVRDIWRRADDDIWVAGDAPLAHWNGSEWQVVSADFELSHIVPTDSGEAWAVGPNGTIAHWTGTQWEHRPLCD